MMYSKIQTVSSFENLRHRIDRLFNSYPSSELNSDQLSLELHSHCVIENDSNFSPSASISNFLDFINSIVPNGAVYLFGGVLRDVALFGKRGFKSDIDVVVDGDWMDCKAFLESLPSKKNKFGGYRLVIDGWPVDIWSARETWAIQEGLVAYNGISSLLDTTVLNWDAILMNWDSKAFIAKPNYLEQIKDRALDIVLIENPNPLGMAVRVFRHLCIKDAKRISISAIEYLVECTRQFSFTQIKESELNSYGNSAIDVAVYAVFEYLNNLSADQLRKEFLRLEETFEGTGLSLAFRQKSWDFDDLADNVIFDLSASS